MYNKVFLMTSPEPIYIRGRVHQWSFGHQIPFLLGGEKGEKRDWAEGIK
jgi:hypothetical protein